jgi:drug/metabolite transporter (DMT)-like permease
MEKISKINRLTVNIFLLIVANDLSDTAAQLLMKKGIHCLFDWTNPQALLFWTGLLIYISNFFLWMFILSQTDLSIALPLASASYILIPIAAVIFLHEFVSPLRWLGLVLIMAGIYCISKATPSGDSP